MMKTKLLALCASAAALLGPGATSAAAQDDRVGTAAMEELLVPVTPRTVALGSAMTAGLANVSGVEAVQSNPAALLSSTGTNALFSRSEYVAMMIVPITTTTPAADASPYSYLRNVVR